MSDRDRFVGRRSVLRSTAAAGTLGITGLAGCTGGSNSGTTNTGSSNSNDTSGGGDTSGSSDPNAVTLGWLLPLTGTYGGLAQFQEQGAKLSIERLNQDGGITGRPVRGVYEDTQADPQTAKQKATKLVEQDEADALFGCISSASGSAVAAYAEQRNVPYFPDVAADELTMDNCRRTTFRYETRASQTAAAAAPWAVENFGTRMWVHNADYLWGNSVAAAWKRESKAAGDVTVVGETTSELGASDFSTYVSQIASSDAEWVVTGINGGDAVNFLKQAASFGLKDQLTIVSPVNSFQFIRKAAGEAVQGTYSAVRYYEGYDYPANEEFVDAFSNEYGNPPDNFALVSWTCNYMYAKAAEQAGSVEADAVIEALPTITYDAPMGETSFRECDHQAARPYNMGEIVAPGEYDWPDIEVTKTVPAEEATVPCEETGCSL